MELEKKLKFGMLLSLYSNLLTSKQKEIFEDYYFKDISLSEIAINNNISRQAVRDCILKVENSLEKYESNLKLGEMFEKTKEICDSILKNSKDEKLNKKINEILDLWQGE